MTREVTEAEAALLDALAAEKPRAQQRARSQARVDQCTVDLEVAMGTLDAFDEQHGDNDYMLTASKDLLGLMAKVRGL